MFTKSMKYEALAQDDSGQGSSESMSLGGEGTFETEKRVKQSSRASYAIFSLVLEL